MPSIIEQKRREVQSAFDAAFRLADSGTDGSLEHFERRLWTQMLALGLALVALWLVRRLARPRATRYEHAGRDWQIQGSKLRTVGTRFGKVAYQSPVGRRVGAPRSASDRPFERELGLCGGFSLLLATTLVKLPLALLGTAARCAQMAFAQARRTHRDMFGWSPSPRAVLRMVDGLGAEARPFIEQAPVPESDGEVLVIQVDGKGAPAISSLEHQRRRRPHRRNRVGCQRHQRRRRRRKNPRPRRAPGKKSKNAKVAVVGVLYTLRRTADGLEGPINKRVYGTFESHRALFALLQQEARRRGYGTAKFSRVLFVADGADCIWTLQLEHFPDAEVCLDWCHAVEKLWLTGKALHRKSRKRLEAWVNLQKKRLRGGLIRRVLNELRAILDRTPRTGPGNKYRRSVLEKTIEHFEKNLIRMRYHRLRRLDLDIGSGVVEGAVRHLVGVRLDGPGMRWGRDRMEAVLLLRCILINGQWEEFERYLAGKQQVVLPSQPVPARTHDARLKKAA